MTKQTNSALPANLTTVLRSRFAAAFASGEQLSDQNTKVKSAVTALATALLDGAEGEGVSTGAATDRFIVAALDCILAGNADWRDASGNALPATNKLWNRALSVCFAKKVPHFQMSKSRENEKAKRSAASFAKAAKAVEERFADTNVPELKKELKHLLDTDTNFLWNCAKLLQAVKAGTTVLRVAQKQEAAPKVVAKTKVVGKIAPKAVAKPVAAKAKKAA